MLGGSYGVLAFVGVLVCLTVLARYASKPRGTPLATVDFMVGPQLAVVACAIQVGHYLTDASRGSGGTLAVSLALMLFTMLFTHRFGFKRTDSGDAGTPKLRGVVIPNGIGVGMLLAILLPT